MTTKARTLMRSASVLKRPFILSANGCLFSGMLRRVNVMETMSKSETSVGIYETTRRSIPEDMVVAVRT